jgi:gliding motility-associated-like protein
MIKNIDLYPQSSITVIDRWGNEIYTARGYNNDDVAWRGTGKNGKALPSGTYFFTLSVSLGDKKLEKKGFIELIN